LLAVKQVAIARWKMTAGSRQLIYSGVVNSLNMIHILRKYYLL
jgi:hypothetical protein